MQNTETAAPRTDALALRTGQDQWTAAEADRAEVARLRAEVAARTATVAPKPTDVFGESEVVQVRNVVQADPFGQSPAQRLGGVWTTEGRFFSFARATLND